jgi:hypothetical protein
VLRNYAIAGQLAVIGDAAQQVGDIIDALIEAEPSLARRHSISCSVASTVPELQAEARRLAAQTPEENAGMVARGELPWPDCVVDLIAGFTHEDASVLALRDFAHDVIIPLTSSNRALAELLAFARQVEALTVQTIRVGTVEVPIGADVLERYTQVDLVTVYMPSGVSMIQPFAAATLYFLDSSQQDEFTARIRPRTWADRVGLQVGYPVGSPLNDPDEPFEPDMMVGLIIRANKQLSGSVGVVFGRNDEGRDNVLFFSTNFDVSSLGALQNLLARRDP